MTDADRLAEIRTMAMWLRGLSEKDGKGVVDNIDARALGRCADMLDAATSGPSAPTRIPVEGYQLPDGTSVVTKWADAPSPTAPSGERVEAVADRIYEALSKWLPDRMHHRAAFIDAALAALSAIGTGEDERLLRETLEVIAGGDGDAQTIAAQTLDELSARHASRQAKPPCE